MRMLETHKGDPTNDAITIEADEAPECYDVTVEHSQRRRLICDWLTNEALLAIVTDRLECVQSGQDKSTANYMGCWLVKQAMKWLRAHRNRVTVESITETA